MVLFWKPADQRDISQLFKVLITGPMQCISTFKSGQMSIVVDRIGRYGSHAGQIDFIFD